MATKVSNPEHSDTHVQVEINQPDGWTSIERVKEYESLKEVLQELDQTCVVFNRFHVSRVLENDTQYDLDSLQDWFRAAYKSVKGQEPSSNLFYNLVSRHCKPDPPDRDYDDDDEW